MENKIVLIVSAVVLVVLTLGLFSGLISNVDCDNLPFNVVETGDDWVVINSEGSIGKVIEIDDDWVVMRGEDDVGESDAREGQDEGMHEKRLEKGDTAVIVIGSNTGPTHSQKIVVLSVRDSYARFKVYEKTGGVLPFSRFSYNYLRTKRCRVFLS